MIRTIVLVLGAMSATCAIAPAQRVPEVAVPVFVPCPSCAISHVQSAEQVRTNQEIVRETLANSLNDRLQSQSSTLQTQATLRSLQLNDSMNASNLDVRQVLLQQQIELLQIEQQAIQQSKVRAPSAQPAHKASKTKKKPPARHV
jgi:hypothetical protein